jgi:hypothetical protein
MKLAKYLWMYPLFVGVFSASMSAMADDLLAREKAARATADQFLKKLGGALQTELKQGGPVPAIKVCRDIAPSIASELSLANGWKVTRVGTRVRNPLLGMPDAWEQNALKQFSDRAAKGEALKGMAVSEVVGTGNNQAFRFAMAIPAQEACLLCHGSPEQLPAGVKAALASTYPHDRAVGYRAGDLRGAVSIIQPMDVPIGRESSN